MVTSAPNVLMQKGNKAIEGLGQVVFAMFRLDEMSNLPSITPYMWLQQTDGYLPHHPPCCFLFCFCPFCTLLHSSKKLKLQILI